MWVEPRPHRVLVATGLAALVSSLLVPAWRWLAADAVATVQPERALALVPHHPRALEIAATQAIAGGDLASAEELAKLAIARRPLEGRAYRVLAAVYEQTGRVAEAYAAHRAAIAVSPNDAISRLWLASRSLEEAQYPEALGHIDRALRARPDLADTVFPVLSAGLGNPDFVAALVTNLAAAPPWRGAFIDQVIQEVAPLETVGLLIDRLADRGRLTERELRAWLGRLAHERRWDALSAAWERFVAPGLRSSYALVDGGFERDPHGFGLGWLVSRVPGAQIGFAPARGSRNGGRALMVRFLDQRVPFAHVQQRLLLSEGRYRLSGEARAESLRARRGLVWEVRCDDRHEPLAIGPALSGTKPWHEWSVAFVVPHDCPSQWLTLRLLAIGPSEEMVGGMAAFDGLGIARLDGGDGDAESISSVRPSARQQKAD